MHDIKRSRIPSGRDRAAGLRGVGKILALGLAAAASGSAAQSLSLRDPAVQAELRRAMGTYAACIVERKGAAVEELLARPYDDRVGKASRDLHDLTCPLAIGRTQFRADILLKRFDGLALRSVLYQALLARDAARLVTRSTMVDPGQDAFTIGRSWPGSPAGYYEEYINKGRCVVTRDAVEARQLVFSPVGSANEASIFEKLRPALSKCKWYTPDITMVRGALAEIVFRANALE